MNSTKAHEIFKEAREQNLVLSALTDPESTSFESGFVAAWTNEHLVIKNLNRFGQYNGFILLPIEKIVRLDFHSRYETKLQNFYALKKHSHPPFLDEIALTADLLHEFFAAAQTHDFAVSLDTGNDQFIEGFVQKVEFSTVTIEQYSEYGEADGISVVSLENVQYASADDKDLRNLKLLARWSDLPPS